MKKVLEPFFLRLETPVLTNALVYFVSFFVYRLSIESWDLVFLIVLLVVFMAIVMAIVSRFSFRPCFKPENFPLARTLSVFIIFSAMFEYAYMGVPILGQIVYAEFGLPLLHHVAVSSWILVFLVPSFKRRLVRLFVLLFLASNPLLMLNRDLLLITIFMATLYFWYKGVFKNRHLFIMAIVVVVIFGLLGQLRSPHALKAVALPLEMELLEFSPILTWVVIYITSSSFNMYYNFDSLSMELYSVFINVFPEAYGWVYKYGSEAYFLLYYGFVLFFLYVFRLLAATNVTGYWFLFYAYLVYQSFMSIFSTKFFTTNTIFVLTVFLLLSILGKFSKSNSND